MIHIPFFIIIIIYYYFFLFFSTKPTFSWTTRPLKDGFLLWVKWTVPDEAMYTSSIYIPPQPPSRVKSRSGYIRRVISCFRQSSRYPYTDSRKGSVCLGNPPAGETKLLKHSPDGNTTMLLNQPRNLPTNHVWQLPRRLVTITYRLG